MKLNHLSITDLGPYRGTNEFDLRTTPDSPIVLFGGKNGAGKTTLFESVQLCLHGQSALGRRTSTSEYESAIREKLHEGPDGKAESGSITIQFEYANMGDRDTYTVERSWRDRGQSIVEDLTVERNGRILNDLDDDQWEDFLKELIPPGVSQLFFFDGEKVQELATTIEEDSGFGDSLLSLLGLDLVERLEADLSLYLTNKLDEGGRSELQEELNELADKIEAKEAELDEVEYEIAEKRDQISEINRRVSDLEDELAQEGGAFAQQRETLKDQRAKLESKKETLEEQIRQEVKGDLPFALAPELCRNVRDRLQEESKKQHASAAREHVVEELDEIAAERKDTLVSETELTEEEVTKIVGELQSELHKRSVEIEGDQQLATSFSEQQRQRMYTIVDEALNEVPKRMADLASRLEQIVRDRNDVQQQLSRAPKKEAIQPILTEINEATERKGEVKNEVEQLETRREELDKRITHLESERERKLDKETQFEDISERADLAKRTREAVKKYKKRLTNRKLDRLEEVLTKRYRMLSNKGEFYAQVHINKETLGVSIETTHGSKKEVSQLSAGERQIFATALIWALAEISDRPLPFIIDTPLGRLDQEHRENLVESFFPKASHQVLVLSTDTEITDQYYDFLTTKTAAEYHLRHDDTEGRTEISSGYFASATSQEHSPESEDEQMTVEGYNE
jgi:DNA sulfur modification protein DndD